VDSIPLSAELDEQRLEFSRCDVATVEGGMGSTALPSNLIHHLAAAVRLCGELLDLLVTPPANDTEVATMS
jgi:hypothetical protein